MLSLEYNKVSTATCVVRTEESTSTVVLSASGDSKSLRERRGNSVILDTWFVLVQENGHIDNQSVLCGFELFGGK